MADKGKKPYKARKRSTTPESGIDPLFHKGLQFAKRVTGNKGSKRRVREAKAKKEKALKSTMAKVVDEPVNVQELGRKKHRTEEEKQRDLAAIARMAVRRMSVAKMVAATGLSESTVYTHLKEIGTYYKEQAKVDAVASRGEQLTIIKELILECWEGIEASKKQITKRRREVPIMQVMDADGKAQLVKGTTGKVVDIQEDRLTNVAYVNAMNSLLNRMSKILGTDTIPDMTKVIEERILGQQQAIRAIAAEVQDPVVLKRIAARMEGNNPDEALEEA